MPFTVSIPPKNNPVQDIHSALTALGPNPSSSQLKNALLAYFGASIDTSVPIPPEIVTNTPTINNPLPEPNLVTQYSRSQISTPQSINGNVTVGTWTKLNECIINTRSPSVIGSAAQPYFLVFANNNILESISFDAGSEGSGKGFTVKIKTRITLHNVTKNVDRIVFEGDSFKWKRGHDVDFHSKDEQKGIYTTYPLDIVNDERGDTFALRFEMFAEKKHHGTGQVFFFEAKLNESTLTLIEVDQ